MKTMRRYNRQSGSTKRKIAQILAERERYDNDHAYRHAVELQRRYWALATGARA